MIDLQALIRASKEALEELQNGTYEIITRSTPATWEDLRSDLETKLIPILKKLYDQIGGLMQQPTVILPDGVTSTSLVSQSEMTQFVTNTLNTWLADLEDRIREAKKNTIYTLQPAVLTYKYVPFTHPVNVSVMLPDLARPIISVSKTGAVTRVITIPAFTPALPTITAEKGA